MESSKSASHLDALQVYRAIAAILVVLYHITILAGEKYSKSLFGGMFSFGYTGVDFFFVLSGFIITYAHAHDIGRREHFGKYAIKRLIRVLPLYWLVTLVKLAVIFVVPSTAKSYEINPQVILHSILLLPQANGYLPIIGAAWTLSHEMLFYALFTLFIVFGWRVSVTVFSVWAVAILANQVIVFGGGNVYGDNYVLRFIFNESNLEFMLGCLGAFLVLRQRVPFAKAFLVLGALLFICAAAYVDVTNRDMPSYTFTFGVSSFLLVIGTATLELRTSVAWPKWLVFLGNASYSIYLTHALFIAVLMLGYQRVANVTAHLPMELTLTLVIVIAIAVGAAVSKFVEQPVLNWLRARLLTRRKEPVLTAQAVGQ